MVVEYAITFFLVVAFVSAMSVYVRRTVQARIRGAAKYASHEAEEVWNNSEANLIGKFYGQYEPYYVQAQTYRTIESTIEQDVFAAGKVGIHQKITNEQTITEATSRQLPPVNAD